MLKASQNKNVLSWRLKAAWDGILRSQDMKFIDVFLYIFMHIFYSVFRRYSVVQKQTLGEVGT